MSHLSGNEIQIGNISHVIHSDMRPLDEIEQIKDRVRKAIIKETGFLIVRFYLRDKFATFSAKHVDIDFIMADIDRYLHRQLLDAFNRQNNVYFPLDFRIMMFRSTSPLAK